MAQGHRTEEDLRERPVGELLKELSDDLTKLVRQEMELAKAEITQKVRSAGAGAGMFGGAGVVAVAAFGAFTAFAILGLSEFVWPWLSAFIVTGLYGLMAGALALSGRSKLKEATPPIPEQTVETVKEDIQWAKTQSKSAKK